MEVPVFPEARIPKIPPGICKQQCGLARFVGDPQDPYLSILESKPPGGGRAEGINRWPGKQESRRLGLFGGAMGLVGDESMIPTGQYGSVGQAHGGMGGGPASPCPESHHW